MRLTQHFAILLLGITAIFCKTSFAQNNYPNKPINFIVPYGAGGGADSRSRQIAQKMSVILKQPIIVDNKPGAGGNIGTEYISRAAPDGYTLGYGNVVSLATNSSLLSSIPYQTKDLTLISNAFRIVNIMAVNPALPIQDVQSLIKYVKENPGKIAFGSDGNGTTSHLGTELFKSMAGIDMLHVPYKGSGPSITDLIGGQVATAVLSPGSPFRPLED